MRVAGVSSSPPVDWGHERYLSVGESSGMVLLDVGGELLEEVGEALGPLSVDGLLTLVGAEDAVGVHEGSLSLLFGKRTRGLLDGDPSKGRNTVGNGGQVIAVLSLASLALILVNGTHGSSQTSNDRRGISGLLGGSSLDDDGTKLSKGLLEQNSLFPISKRKIYRYLPRSDRCKK